ncbi:hypothetical protein [Rubidibacter lacunae]|nr:hypothetical protein [Rubidibacter lacunae]
MSVATALTERVRLPSPAAATREEFGPRRDRVVRAHVRAIGPVLSLQYR